MLQTGVNFVTAQNFVSLGGPCVKEQFLGPYSDEITAGTLVVHLTMCGFIGR